MQNDTNTTQVNEFDLLQLCRTLWEGKWLIASCMALALLLAGVYVFLVAQPRYASSIHLGAPAASSLDELNRERERANFTLAGTKGSNREAGGLELYTPKKVFGFFTESLGSDGTFQQFIRTILRYPDDGLVSASTLAQNTWRVQITGPADNNLYKVTVSAESPELTRRHLTLFLETAQDQALATLLDDASNSVSARIAHIENTLATQRAIARKQREDRIVRLREALAIAAAVGQETPQVNLAPPSAPESLADYLEGTKLYAQGARALRAELEVLESRENDDAFIEDLRENEARLKLLRAISPQGDSLLLYRVDGTVLSSEAPIRPRKALTLALALVLGGMLGVFWVLLRGMVRAQQRGAGKTLSTDTA